MAAFLTPQKKNYVYYYVWITFLNTILCLREMQHFYVWLYNVLHDITSTQHMYVYTLQQGQPLYKCLLYFTEVVSNKII